MRGSLRGSSGSGSDLRRVLGVAMGVVLLGGCAGDADPGEGRLSIGELLGGGDTLHARAVDVRPFTFPADHGPHPEFRTEWWYFTGNLTADDGHEFGYQLTFFRSALSDSAAFIAGAGDSPWRARHAWMAHFAVTDITAERFHAGERFARGAVGLAGAELRPFRVWTAGWQAQSIGDEVFPLRLEAADADVAINLVLGGGEPIVLQGDSGLSRKGAQPGNASYYYSMMRLPTRGTVRTASGTYTVTGSSWLDREWSTSVLAPGITGWDWMALQLDDGAELMVYQLRREDGSADAFSAATLVLSDGTVHRLDADEFTLRPSRPWGAAPGAPEYPTQWTVEIPSRGIRLDVSAALPAQELTLSVRYWEGSVRIRGTRDGQDVRGRGYLEMTGY